MKKLFLAVVAAGLMGGFSSVARAADTDIAWKWDVSGRTEPTPAVVAKAEPLVDTLFRMTVESEQGIVYVGLLMIMR